MAYRTLLAGGGPDGASAVPGRRGGGGRRESDPSGKVPRDLPELALRAPAALSRGRLPSPRAAFPPAPLQPPADLRRGSCRGRPPPRRAGRGRRRRWSPEHRPAAEGPPRQTAFGHHRVAHPQASGLGDAAAAQAATPPLPPLRGRPAPPPPPARPHPTPP